MQCPDRSLNLPDTAPFPAAYAQDAEDVLLMLEYNMRRYMGAMMREAAELAGPQRITPHLLLLLAVKNQSAEHAQMADEALANALGINAMLGEMGIEPAG